MKKVLCIWLVLIMAFSLLPLSTFAQSGAKSNIIGFSSNEAEVLDNSNIEDFGTLIIGKDKTTLEIPIYFDGFETKPGTVPTEKDLTETIMNRLTLHFDPPSIGRLFNMLDSQGNVMDSGIEYVQYTDNAPGKIVLTGRNIGSADGYVYAVYNDKANPPQTSAKVKINGRFVDPTINSKIVTIRDYKLGSAGMTLNGKDVDLNDIDKALNLVSPGSELVFNITSENFEWEPNITHIGSKVRKSSLDNNFISVHKRVTAGADLIKDVAIENIDGHGYVVVRFEEFFSKVEPKDFDVTIALSQRGVLHEPTRIRLIGTLENEEYSVYEDNDYVYTGDGIVVKAMASARNVTFAMDHDETIKLKMNLIDGKKYYARATDEVSKDDQTIMDAYPVIRKAYTIHSKNIGSSAKIVEFNTERAYFVYDAKGELLGTTKEKLPFRSKYYLALEEISIDTELLEDQAEMLDLAENPNTGAGISELLQATLIATGSIATIVGGVVITKTSKKKSNQNKTGGMDND